MLDVLHYLFEKDTDFVSGEHMQSKTNSRQVIYKHVYKRDFKYAYGGTSQTGTYDDSFEDKYLNDEFLRNAVSSEEVKPYVPPTNFDPDAANPFQGTLRERPLG